MVGTLMPKKRDATLRQSRRNAPSDQFSFSPAGVTQVISLGSQAMPMLEQLWLSPDNSFLPWANVRFWHKCPLLGVKRTLLRLAPMSAFDPKRTLTNHSRTTSTVLV
jgi:hypothetical protein